MDIPFQTKQEDSDLEINPLNVFQQDDADDDEDEARDLLVTEEQNLEGGKQYYLQSIKTSVVIRQLPCQGLFQLWPAATTLVNLLDHHHQSSNNIKTPLSEFRLCRRILELGSAILSSSCVITDLLMSFPTSNSMPMPIRLCFRLRGASVNVAGLRWGNKDDMELVGREFDIILGSDVVYYDYLYEPLYSSSEAAPVFLMAHLKRWKKESVFFRKARKMFNVEVIHTDTPKTGCRIGVLVYCFSGKKQQKHSNPQPRE
ncbi:hypothetical protein MKW92_009645 [Papaver armeniacum]|nr:hypothetical protein MKW92_009645 [Papaver armeniacum]